MALETWAVVLFTLILTIVEVHRWANERWEKQLERTQRKIEIAFLVSRWTWGNLVEDREQLMKAAKAFQEMAAVLDFPGDQVIENDVRNVLGGLMAILQGTRNVDKSAELGQVQDRIRWGLMGWVEESERLRHPIRSWWIKLRSRMRRRRRFL